jgi:hypothetical protein
MRKFRPMGLSVPIAFLEKIDEARGDVSRSRYIQRLLQKNCNDWPSEAQEIKQEGEGI